MTQEIPLTQGKVATVCDCHYHLVKGNKWYAHLDRKTQSFYAQRNTSIAERLLGAPKTIFMHVVVNNTPKGHHTDHADGDKLNNQCSNLRTASLSENNRNRGIGKYNTSGFKGVGWDKPRRKWRAQIRHDGKSCYLGLFDNIEDAARAYDAKAKEIHGEFAKINFPAR